MLKRYPPVPARKGGNEPAQVFLFANGLALPIPAPEGEISRSPAFHQLARDEREGVRRKAVTDAPDADGASGDAKQRACGLRATQRLNDVVCGREI